MQNSLQENIEKALSKTEKPTWTLPSINIYMYIIWNGEKFLWGTVGMKSIDRMSNKTKKLQKSINHLSFVDYWKRSTPESQVMSNRFWKAETDCHFIYIFLKGGKTLYLWSGRQNLKLAPLSRCDTEMAFSAVSISWLLHVFPLFLRCHIWISATVHDSV